MSSTWTRPSRRRGCYTHESFGAKDSTRDLGQPAERTFSAEAECWLTPCQFRNCSDSYSPLCGLQHAASSAWLVLTQLAPPTTQLAPPTTQLALPTVVQCTHFLKEALLHLTLGRNDQRFWIVRVMVSVHRDSHSAIAVRRGGEQK